MATYALTVFQDEVRSPMPAPEDIPEVMAKVGAHQEELKAAGVWVFFGALTAADSATVVQSVDGELSMTDGPYIEAREQIGGFTVIDVAGLDEALEWARKGSEACGWPIEVRPFMDGPPT
jgi:hypothetical protein